MPFETNKPMKTCKFCSKQVANLAMHIINNHPSILEQLDETTPNASPNTSVSTASAGVIPQNKPVTSDINALIREKLETMMNIKIIEMLASSKDVSLSEIGRAINPPPPVQQIGLKEIKEYHDLIYAGGEMASGGNDWVGLATAALPIISQMLPAKKRQMEEVKNDEPRENERRSIRILKPVQKETSGNREESGGASEQSGGVSGEPKQDDRINQIID